MTNDDLDVIAATVAQKLFEKLYGGKDLDLVEHDQKLSYCALVAGFVLSTFREEMERALNEPDPGTN
jgi:hypothetical protein